MDSHTIVIEGTATVSPHSKFIDHVPGGGGYHPGATGFVVEFRDIHDVAANTVSVSRIAATYRYNKEPLQEGQIPYTRWHADGGAPGVFFAYVVPTSHLVTQHWDVDYQVMKPGAYEWGFAYLLNGKEYAATQNVTYTYNKPTWRCMR